MQLLLDPDISTYIAQVYNVIKCINTWGRLSAISELVQVYIRLQNVPSLFVDPKKGQSAKTIHRFYINTIKMNTKFYKEIDHECDLIVNRVFQKKSQA